MRARALSRSGLAAAAALSLLWGYTWVAMKEALRFADPFDFAAIRTVAGALLLFAAMLWSGRTPRLRAGGRVFWFGLCQTAGFNGFVSWALLDGAAGKTAVLVYTFPFWTLLLAWPLAGERVRGAQWLVVALAAAGLALVLEPWHLAGTLAAKLLALATALCWALSAVLAKRWRLHEALDLGSLTAWQMLFGGAVLAAIACAVPSRPIEWTGYFWAILVYCTLGGTLLGWMLWLYVLERLPAGMAGLSIMAVPGLGVLFSRWQLAERPGAVELAGMVLIGASLALLSIPALRASEAVRQPH
jgi:drug/metabolite transporter (DMT)-like permease